MKKIVEYPILHQIHFSNTKNTSREQMGSLMKKRSNIYTKRCINAHHKETKVKSKEEKRKQR